MTDVVWAEDSGADQFLIQAVLDELDPPLDVAFADDGEAALRLVERHRPAFVVLDLRMPRLDGLEVLRRLRSGPAQASRVMVFSSSVRPQEVDAARALGAAGFLQKPVDYTAFRSAVRLIAAKAADARSDAAARAPAPGLGATPGNHHVLFWESEPALLDATARFLQEGERAGHGLVVLATQEHAGRLRERLGSADAVWLDAHEVLDDARRGHGLDVARFERRFGEAVSVASRAGRRPVSCFGELVALLHAEGLADDAMAIEAVGQRAAGQGPEPVTILCAYPLATVAPATLATTCALHTSVSGLPAPPSTST